MKDKHIWDEVNKNINSEITRKDEFYSKIQKEYFSKRKKDRVLWTWILIPVISAIVVVLGITIHFISVNNKPPLEYAEDNKIIVGSSIDEINNSSKYFCFNFDVVKDVKIERFYDSVSGDTLLYSIECVYGESEISLFFVSNIRYDYKYNIAPFEGNTNISGLQFLYDKQYEEYFLTMKAFTEKQGQKIMVTYQELSEDGSEDSFWNFIESFIIVKQ